jgi:NADH-quinone oxidoreductase subunit C
VDWPDQGQLEVLYDYNRLGDEHCRVMVRVRLPRDTPELPTISGVFPSADWHERETFDFYGVIFLDHPNLIRILLPEEADFFPLRKDYLP